LVKKTEKKEIRRQNKSYRALREGNQFLVVSNV